MSKVRAEWGRLQSDAIRAAERSCGLSREDIAERLEANPQLVPLTARVLVAAGMTGHDEILHSLGAALGEALLRPDHVGEVELVVIGLERIRPVHVKVLELLPGPSPEQLKKGSEAEIPWNADSLSLALGLPSDRCYTLGIGLVNSGFAESVSVLGGGSGFRITTLGSTLLDVLSAYRQHAG